MKILFCDIDGVLTSEETAKKTGIFGIEESKLELLKEILDKTGSELVITSKARFLADMYKERLEIIKNYGIKVRDAFEGSLTSVPKAIECLSYLQNKVKDFDNYLILDDNDDSFSDYCKDHFIKIDPRVGLTKKDAEEAIKMLGE